MTTPSASSLLVTILRHAAVGIVVVLTMVVAVWYCGLAIRGDLRHWNYHGPPSWVGMPPGTAKPNEKVCDVDTRLIHNGLLQAPRLRDTGRWWTGTWVAQVPFYRPLTSMLFWMQWKRWGDYEFRYHLLAVVLHLLAVWQFVRLAADLFRRFHIPHAAFATLVTGFTFITGLGLIAAQALINSEVFSLWKNQPDALSLLFFCLALRAYLHLQNSGEPSVPVRVAPYVLHSLVCLTKEAGVFLPLLLPFLERDNFQAGGASRRAAIRRMLPLLTALPIYLLLRAAFLRAAIGYSYGSNQAWDFRLVSNIFGPLSQAFALRAWYPLGLTLLILLGAGALIVRPLRERINRPYSRIRLAVVAASMFLLVMGFCGILDYLTIGNPNPVVGVTLLLSPEVIPPALSIVAFVLTVGIGFARRPWLSSFAYAWALLALALTLFSPSVLHRYYLMNAGYALLIGAGAALWLDVLLPRIGNLFRAPRHSLT